jgi:hypothetical protein
MFDAYIPSQTSVQLPRYQDTNMLCAGCTKMLSGVKGLSYYGTYGHTYEHHKSSVSIRRSAEVGCAICVLIAQVLPPASHISENLPTAFRTYLQRRSTEPGQGMLFHLNISHEKKHKYTFVLAETSKFIHPDGLYTCEDSDLSRIGGSNETNKIF